MQQLAGDEGLTEANFVGDHGAAGVADQAQGARGAVLLEAGERQVLIVGRVFLHLAAVELPQHANEDFPGRARPQRRLEHGAQVVRLRFVPELVEPPACLLDGGPVVAAEIELQVAGEPGAGQVGGPGDDAVGLAVGAVFGGKDVGFGVQERFLVAAHLHVAAAQRRAQRAQGSGAGTVERKRVPLPVKRFVQALQPGPDTAAFERRRGLVEAAALAGGGGRQIGAEQQPHRGHRAQIPRNLRESRGVEERGGDAHQIGRLAARLLHHRAGAEAQRGPEGAPESVALAVVDEVRVRSHRPPPRER